jgi:N-dimethylarginine dimethylaminohydrolase
MKKFFQIAAWVFAIGGIIVGVQVYTKHKSNEQGRKETIRKAVIQTKKETSHKAIIELVDKYNAIIDWKKPLSKIESNVFTMEVEDALLRKDNRPVLFLASVEDIKRKEDKYLASFLVDVLELGCLSKINVALVA